MWVLQGNDLSAGKVHYLVCGQTLVVGRRDGHILLSNDPSISRKHAAFNLTFPPSNVKTREAAKVELSDLESKYGTFINENIEKEQQLPSGATQELHHGDLVRFGRFNNIWRLQHQDLTVTTSTLKTESRQQLMNTLLTLGGHLQKDWSSDCCYLVMPTVTLTVKVTCALAAGRSIVLPEFFTKLVDAIINKLPLPNPEQFLPPVLELNITTAGASFIPDPCRSSIFTGLTFLFPTQAQMTKMCSPVQLAGGKVELLTEDNYQKVVSGKFLLISLLTQSQPSNVLYRRTCDLLKQHGLRTITDSEIGLAIIFVSVEGHCNSSFKDVDIFKRSFSTSQSSEKLKIFATETQATELSVSLTGTKVVPDSGGRQPGTSAQKEMPAPAVPSKRPLPTSAGSGGKAKRTNRAPSPDLTIPLSSMELDDDDQEEDGTKMVVQDNTFMPKHTSTQRDDLSLSTTLDPSATASFAPYTLPSLKTLQPEEEDSEPILCDRPQENLLQEEEGGTKVKKDDPKVKSDAGKDLKFDEWWKRDKEEEDLRNKRARSEETSPQDRETKKTKTDTSSNNNNLTCNNSYDNNNGKSSKRMATNNAETLFVLPPRPRQRERTVANLTLSRPAAVDSDLFTLPTRAPRTKKLPAHQDSTLVPSSSPSPTQDTTVIHPTPEPTPNVTLKKKNIAPTEFIDRNETTTTIKDSDDPELSTSRTLVVVEPLIKRQPTTFQPPTRSHDSNNLPNFKVFKKVSATFIMKIIGESDFMEYGQTEASQAFKIDAEDSMNNRSLQKGLLSFDEDLFDLDNHTKKRRRMN